MPFLRHSSTASWITLRASASISAGVIFSRAARSARPSRPDAVSRRGPSDRRSHPSGPRRPAVGRGLRDARQGHGFRVGERGVALAWVSTTGLSGDTRRAMRASGILRHGLGPLRPFLLCQPRPTIHSPGFAFFTASATIATIFVPARRRHQLEPQLRLADALEVAVALDDARDGQRALQVDDLRRRPMYALISASVPTAAIVSPRIASARASGVFPSTVTIRPLWMTSVAGSTRAAPGPPARQLPEAPRRAPRARRVATNRETDAHSTPPGLAGFTRPRSGKASRTAQAACYHSRMHCSGGRPMYRVVSLMIAACAILGLASGPALAQPAPKPEDSSRRFPPSMQCTSDYAPVARRLAQQGREGDGGDAAGHREALRGVNKAELPLILRDKQAAWVTGVGELKQTVAAYRPPSRPVTTRRC